MPPAKSLLVHTASNVKGLANTNTIVVMQLQASLNLMMERQMANPILVQASTMTGKGTTDTFLKDLEGRGTIDLPGVLVIFV